MFIINEHNIFDKFLNFSDDFCGLETFSQIGVLSEFLSVMKI